MEEYKIDQSLGYLVGKTSWYLKTNFVKITKENNIDVTIEHWSLLNIIFKNPGISQTQIANIVRKDKTNVTRILDVMTKKNLVVRKNDKNDRRAYKIHLTKHGEETLSKLIPLAKETNQYYEEILGEKDSKALRRVLNKLSDDIRAKLF